MMRACQIVTLFVSGSVAFACGAPRSPEAASPATPEKPAEAPTATLPGEGQPPIEESKPGTPSSAEGGGPDRDKKSLDDDRSQQEYASLAEAEAALEKARAELGPDRPRSAEPPKASTKKPTTAPAPKADASAAQPESADRCLNACKAFASLKRAASAVCRLAGESHARCKRAQGIVQENEARVAACKCEKNGD